VNRSQLLHAQQHRLDTPRGLHVTAPQTGGIDQLQLLAQPAQILPGLQRADHLVSTADRLQERLLAAGVSEQRQA
jgi:hypothetical protein